MEIAQLENSVVHTCWNRSADRMAAACADGTIQIWDAKTAGDGLDLTIQWKADVGGPSPRVVWAPSEFGDVLASGSVDGSISVWEEVVLDGEIEKTFKLTAKLEEVHCPILDLQFGTTLSGLKLIAVFADGHARIYGSLDVLNLKSWQLQAEIQNARTLAERNSTNSFYGASVSWKSSTLTSPHPAFVFGCNSTSNSLNTAKVWEFEQSHQRWFCIAELRGVDEDNIPVNHVSWAPNIGRSYEMIAVASGNRILIWTVKFSAATQERVSAQQVACLISSNEEVWQVEWDMSGMTLASSGSSGTVRLWQANLKGEWEERTQYSGF